MQLALQIGEMILAVLLILIILVQQRGTGLGGAFGGSGGVYRTRRGAERFLFRTTIVLAILFVLTALFLVMQ